MIDPHPAPRFSLGDAGTPDRIVDALGEAGLGEQVLLSSRIEGTQSSLQRLLQGVPGGAALLPRSRSAPG